MLLAEQPTAMLCSAGSRLPLSAGGAISRVQGQIARQHWAGAIYPVHPRECMHERSQEAPSSCSGRAASSAEGGLASCRKGGCERQLLLSSASSLLPCASQFPSAASELVFERQEAGTRRSKPCSQMNEVQAKGAAGRQGSS
jgi:hypothetical protein